MNKITQIINKKNKEKLVCLTAYTYPIAKIVNNYCDIVLVGDSLGMAIYGMPDTIDTTLDMMINHGKAVCKACPKPLVVVDLPYGSYEQSKEQALASAKLVLQQTGCDAIKIETDSSSIATVAFLTANNVPVMAHVGLLPQQVRKIGGYRYTGKDQAEADKIYQIALELQQAKAFAMVIEAVPQNLATKITTALTIPTIGIGASLACDGQILVIDDMLGLNTDFKPRFVEHYANIANNIEQAVANFASDVKLQKFPKEHNLL